MTEKKLQVTLDLEDDGSLYGLYSLLSETVGKPFSVEWPRGEGSEAARAKILMEAGARALRGWKPPVKPFHIMSFDGGGLRGIFASRALFRLSHVVPDVIRDVDMYAGTSTGAIIAVLLSFGMNPEEIFDLYQENIEKIFADNVIDDVRDLGKVIGADYSLEPLDEILTARLGNMTIGDLKKPTLVVSFALDGVLDGVRTWKPKIMHNIAERGKENPDCALKLVDVILRSVAAPTYFPSYQGHIDGGVAANDPAMCAISQALDRRGLGIPLDALRVLSFGTGKGSSYISGDHDWGLAQWAKPMVDILMDGNMGMARYQAKAILGDRYHRLNGSFGEAISLDDIRDVPKLIAGADNLSLADAISWVASVWLPDPTQAPADARA